MSIRVVACIIEREGKLLVCERPPEKRHGGLWEFPGGKVEPEESDLEAVRRELLEELGVRAIAIGAISFACEDPGSRFQLYFLPVTIEGEPIALEHTRIAWVGEEELLGLALAPSDRAYAKFRLRAGGAPPER